VSGPAIAATITSVLCVALLARADGARATHVRLRTEHGPVHVWTPKHYDPATAGIVVYVHGFYTNVDRAWRKHRLARQFAESKINALFIACEAPSSGRKPVRWARIGALLDAVADGLGRDLPTGPVIAVGHSGAHRTLKLWLDEDRIDTIVLVDAVFDQASPFRDWVEADPHRRLIDVAADTRPWTEALHARMPETVVYNRFPPARAGKLRGARRARVVYVRSQLDHMSLVTGGVALPMLLRAVRLPVVANASRKAPIRVR
jgi:hypothetical protein